MTIIKKIVEITFKRNGKEKTMMVEATTRKGEKHAWIRKENGKPFYGVTGHYLPNSMGDLITSYRHKTIVTDVKGLENIFDISEVGA